MLQRFRKYLNDNGLFHNSDKILLAVSGGIDSMVMLHLMTISHPKISIAHCNFGLRGEESDEDELFVKNITRQLKIPFFAKKFDTLKYAIEKKVSIQLAARELRYNWFEEIIKKENFDFYATAHNLDDRIETFFINAFRGSGVSGLRSINNKSGNCIRPLLFATRKEIEFYAQHNQIAYREDSSNLKDDYTRNKIRHHLIPILEIIEPDFRTGLQNTFSILSDTQNFIYSEIENWTKKLSDISGENITISIAKLKYLNDRRFILFEILKHFGYNISITENILRALFSNEPSGKRFFSASHELIIDREFLIIRLIEKKNLVNEFLIEITMPEIHKPFKMKCSVEYLNSEFNIHPSRSFGQFDLDKLKFPLKIRRPQPGDYFYPLGMKGKKLLSDFFTDIKLSVFAKRDSWVLESNGKIVWVVGCRIDDRFKITSKTTRVFVCNLI
jgi:tRNA(Ile)-lysidine synthase